MSGGGGTKPSVAQGGRMPKSADAAGSWPNLVVGVLPAGPRVPRQVGVAGGKAGAGAARTGNNDLWLGGPAPIVRRLK